MSMPSDREGYLFDTSVLSLLAPGREGHLPAAFAAWLLKHSDRLYIPCIAVAEIEQGICKLRRAGGAARADRLAQWLDSLIENYSSHVLPLDTSTSRLAGKLAEQAIATGRHPGFADIAIAALAMNKGLLLMTRNLKHFEPLRIPCADPLEKLPD